MIPPAPITKFQGPINNKASGYDEKIVSKKQPIIQGDNAEAIVHEFLAKSKQPAFVLQNFTTSRWKRIFGSLGYDFLDGSLEEMKNIDDIEIDFLIFHACAGIIAVECKSVDHFQKNRYNECKKQLNKVNNLVMSFHKMLQRTHNQTDQTLFSIPVKKVISFPFVEMRVDVSDPYNLGKNDINDEPYLWWDRLLESQYFNENKFETDILYQDLITLALGMYNAVELSVGENVMDIYERIEKQRFYEGCSNVVYRRTQEELSVSDQLFFLNPQQQQVMKCQANQQIISGEVGTGKTVLLMLKALDSMMRGEKVVLVVPRSLKPKYNSFRKKYKTFGRCEILSHEKFDWQRMSKYKKWALFFDELQNVVDMKHKRQLWRKSKSENCLIKLCDYAVTCPSAQIVAVLSNRVQPDSSTEHPYIWKEAANKISTGNFHLFHLTSITRGTCEIVKHWRNLSPVSRPVWTCLVICSLLSYHLLNDN